MGKEITIVDARMGRGKSSAAIRYMNENKGRKRFLYITPYLKEVDRICEQCDFEQPEADRASKSAELKAYLARGQNVAATHALFYLLDDEALELVCSRRYSLIVDESISAAERLLTTHSDFDIITEQLTTEGENGKLRWRDPGYSGAFVRIKDAADAGALFRVGASLIKMLDPEIFRAFDEVTMLTYLFNGQYQKGYLDCHGFKYRVVGIEHDERGARFSDKPDEPGPVDFGSLIRIVDVPRMNAPGNGRLALSKGWYSRHGYSSKEVTALRNGMRNFFQDITKSTKDDRLWTCFKDHQQKLVDRKTGRYRRDFLQSNARATNEYRHKTNIAYMVNRFVDPNLEYLFASRGRAVDEDLFALSEMLQWIWRSAIRVGEPINLYIPSSRMRGLLTDWIEQNT